MSNSDENLPNRLARLEEKAYEAIWSGTRWLSHSELSSLTCREQASPSELTQWVAERRIFSLDRNGEAVYPQYAFDAECRPLAAIKAIADILPWLSPTAMAMFFESTSSFLGGQRPRELIASSPERVVSLAKDRRRSERPDDVVRPDN